MSIKQIITSYVTCDALGCTKTLGKDKNLNEYELKQQLKDECWEIDGNIFVGLTYCPEHAENTE